MSESEGHGVLGKTVDYVDQYDRSLLHPIPRAAGRQTLGLNEPLPFRGFDIWNAWELSWLNEKGKPEVAIGVFTFPANSPNIVESKSLKLYLNSYNQSRFGQRQRVVDQLCEDLTMAAGCSVHVELYSSSEWSEFAVAVDNAKCLDDLDITPADYHPNPSLLRVVGDGPVSERLCSHLLRSRCPVTGQPDWATVFIEYRGRALDHNSLLAYLISFRRQNDFHEQCVEQIFRDIWQHGSPDSLTVSARYLRRGGLDINPWRSSELDKIPLNHRTTRQ